MVEFGTKCEFIFVLLLSSFIYATINLYILLTMKYICFELCVYRFVYCELPTYIHISYYIKYNLYMHVYTHIHIYLYVCECVNTFTVLVVISVFQVYTHRIKLDRLMSYACNYHSDFPLLRVVSRGIFY